jgi:hypothetical protein
MWRGPATLYKRKENVMGVRWKEEEECRLSVMVSGLIGLTPQAGWSRTGPTIFDKGTRQMTSVQSLLSSFISALVFRVMSLLDSRWNIATLHRSSSLADGDIGRR